jgi:hypothetical protein
MKHWILVLVTMTVITTNGYCKTGIIEGTADDQTAIASKKYDISDAKIKKFAKKCDGLIANLNNRKITLQSFQYVFNGILCDIANVKEEELDKSLESLNVLNGYSLTGLDKTMSENEKKEKTIEYIQKNCSPNFSNIAGEAIKESKITVTNSEISKDKSMNNNEKFTLIMMKTIFAYYDKVKQQMIIE